MESKPVVEETEEDLLIPNLALLASLPDDSRLLGTWLYGSKPQRYQITRTNGNQFRFMERLGQKDHVFGLLRAQGPWFHANILFGDGTPMGTIRLRLVQDKNVVVSNVKAPGETEWSADMLAHRVSTTGNASPPETPRDGLWTGMPGVNRWSSRIACCSSSMSQNMMKVAYAYIENPQPTEKLVNCHRSINRLRSTFGAEPIMAFTEFRHPFSPQVRDVSACIDHIYTVIEVSPECTWAICLERLWEGLEICCGEYETLLGYVRSHRASGQLRDVAGDSSVSEGIRRGLGPEASQKQLIVSDLCDWIEGPLAARWQPYSPVGANGPHFAVALQAFLNGKELASVFKASDNSCKPQGFAHQAAQPALKPHQPHERQRPRLDASEIQMGHPVLMPELPVLPRLWADRATVLAAVKHSGEALQHATPELKADREIILAAVNQDGAALAFAAESLQSDPEVVTAALRQCPQALKNTSASVRADVSSVILAVSQDGLALQHAAPELQANREVVMAAVQRTGLALRFAAPVLQADREVVMASVKQDWRALSSASRDLADSREVVEEAVKRHWGALQLATPTMRSDRGLVLQAMEQDWRSFMLASKELKADKEVVLFAVRRHGLSLQVASKPLQADREVVLAALAQDAGALNYVAPSLKNDREVVLTAVRRHWSALQKTPPALRADFEVAEAAVRQSVYAFEHVAEELRSDPRLWLQAEAESKAETDAPASSVSSGEVTLDRVCFSEQQHPHSAHW